MVTYMVLATVDPALGLFRIITVNKAKIDRIIGHIVSKN